MVNYVQSPSKDALNVIGTQAPGPGRAGQFGFDVLGNMGSNLPRPGTATFAASNNINYTIGANGNHPNL